MTIWGQLARAVALEVQIGDEIVHHDVATLDHARQARFDVSGLAPGTLYRVRIVADTGAEIVHQVQTAPAIGDVRPVRLAVSADFDPYEEFDSELLEHVVAAAPDLFVSIGDFPYTDNGPPAQTVEEYRARHVDGRTSPRVRQLLGAVGMRAIYDDHEFRNDWDAMYRDVERDRYVAAMQVWDEFFPLRRSDGVRYRSWRWGAHAECFLLDCRQFRSANKDPDIAGKTMLGETQLAWLIDGLRASTAPFKLVFTSVPLDFGDGNDHWSSFKTERTRMFDALAGVPGILFVSADQHWFAAHRHERGIREFQVGPIARGIGMPMRTADGVLFRSEQYNVGLIDIDDASLTFSGLGADGMVFYKETLSVEDLTPAS
ncbi:MAG TPA: alkaline phosphatase D family protein [Kofleriaceae bacterium]|nr:alkaline phosphatase D family protein [Kofleriaceae bacterium]